MPTLAAYAQMLERDRKREGLRVCRAARPPARATSWRRALGSPTSRTDRHSRTEAGGIRGYDIGPLAPNDPYEGNYPGENRFTPDAIVSVISNERCA
jgi:hypothetical protein